MNISYTKETARPEEKMNRDVPTGITSAASEEPPHGRTQEACTTGRFGDGLTDEKLQEEKGQGQEMSGSFPRPEGWRGRQQCVFPDDGRERMRPETGKSSIQRARSRAWATPCRNPASPRHALAELGALACRASSSGPRTRPAAARVLPDIGLISACSLRLRSHLIGT